MRTDERMPKLRLVAEPFSVIPISRFQTAHLVPAARCPRPGFASLLRSPAKRVGGAPRDVRVLSGTPVRRALGASQDARERAYDAARQALARPRHKTRVNALMT